MMHYAVITEWRGRNVDTLTREEAIEALKEAVSMLITGADQAFGRVKARSDYTDRDPAKALEVLQRL